ncbi:EVE domain-containing protein [Paludibacterium paludis]|uniref:EVE domain-containing protein n=1 Tax=Paludibacterium paludis TaxID=1225769 RepID=A0A918P2H3_9NEIS|nr:EVE domain-containing protein [Paludibacterium paludis]GGY15962.1 EVE domain-containing protein [Paludibacterium paludis]
MRYWLMKSEPEDLSIDDLAAEPDRDFEWTGVRNYQARNFMRDGMREGDLVLFWHSSCATPGIAGIAVVSGAARADSSQFDPASPWHDPAADPASPRWVSVMVRFVSKSCLVPTATLRATPGLEDMQVLRKGNRLSVTPVSDEHWHLVQPLLTPR